MARLRSLQDVVDWGLCIGCGTCFHLCGREAVSLVNLPEVGIRARYHDASCLECGDCLAPCPGYQLDSPERAARYEGGSGEQYLIGPTLEIWEGYAADPEIRWRGSSGGALTALALYCLEREGMAFVLHTAMDPERPWQNRTVQSRTRTELLAAAGSRYAPSSPCEGLGAIEEADRPCLFIGKPCDTAPVMMVRKMRPQLDARLGAVLTFFCAGTPSTRGTLQLLERLGAPAEAVTGVHYRGEGWPGRFRVELKDGAGGGQTSLSYEDSWGRLESHRPLRCHLCPDALGEIADLSCGDAWHRPREGDPGRSIILVRSERGRAILRAAVQAGYLTVSPSGPKEVVAAQGIIRRRRQLYGRLLARRLLGLPVPRYPGFHLQRGWRTNPVSVRMRVVLGTVRRILQRGLWRRRPLFPRPGRAADSGHPAREVRA
jgi:coenzyme F420 hydrogenase subunit beta